MARSAPLGYPCSKAWKLVINLGDSLRASDAPSTVPESDQGGRNVDRCLKENIHTSRV